MKGVGEKTVVERVEEIDKEKKKRRRSNRRPKQNSTVSGTSCSSVDVIQGEASEYLGNSSPVNYMNMSTGSSSSQKCGLEVHASTDQGLDRASNVAFSSLPTMHVNSDEADLVSPSYLEGTLFSISCPEPICGEVPHVHFPNKILISEARVLDLGPKFMSIYVDKLDIERRINYAEVEGLTVEWLETTSTLVLSLCANRRSQRRCSPNKCKKLEDVAWIVNSCDLNPKQVMLEYGTNEVGAAQATLATGVAFENPGPGVNLDTSDISDVDPPVFPLTVQVHSTIYVALQALRGHHGPLDIGARLYVSSYLM